MALIDLQQGKVPEKRNTLSFKKANRPLDENETEALEKSTKYNKFQHPKINPVPGTLAYTFRNLEGGNEAVVEFMKRATKTNTTKFVKEFLIVWRNLDEFSKKRIDIFDCFCEKYEVNKGKFFGIVQEGLFGHEQAMQQISLAGHTPEFIELVKRMASKERNQQDRALLAKMLKLDEAAPLVSIQDNSVKNEVHIHEKASVPSFISSIRKGDEGIRKEVSAKPEVKQLSEGKQDYIDAEIVSETRKEVPVELSEEDKDWKMRKLGQEL